MDLGSTINSGADHAPNVDFDSFETIQLIKGAAALNMEEIHLQVQLS